MLKITVENGVMVIVGRWETVSEELFGFPECESVEKLVEWMERSGKGIIEVGKGITNDQVLRDQLC